MDRPQGLAQRPRATTDDKQAKAQRTLNVAIESHDIDMLKKAIAGAEGLPKAAIEGAQRALDFEVNRELFQDLLHVRTAVDSLTQTVQKVESQVKSISGGVSLDCTTSAEAWVTAIVQQVEGKLWASMEKCVEEKVREAVAGATKEISASAKELMGLLSEVTKSENTKAPSSNRKLMTSPSMRLDSSDDSSDSDAQKGKGKGKSKTKGVGGKGDKLLKAPVAAGASNLLAPEAPVSNAVDDDHQHHVVTNSLHHGKSNERRPSNSMLGQRPSVSNSRVGPHLGFEPKESPQKKVEVKTDEPPAKKRKPVEVTPLTPFFNSGSKEIENILRGHPQSGDEQVDEIMKQVPLMLEEPQNWGLRVKDVKKFYDYIQQDLFGYCKKEQALGTDFNENLHTVTPRFIKPWTIDFKPYSLAGVINADNLTTMKITSLEEIMTARIFISHCWNENFGDFCSTMNSIFSGDDTVWVCALSICQNVDIQTVLGESIEDSPFWRAMPHCKRVTMLIDRKAEPFERAWCALEEYLATYKLRLPFSICMPEDMNEDAWNEVDYKLQNFSIRNCKASQESDKQKIMDIIGDKAEIIDRVVRDESQKACFAARVMSVATKGSLEDLFPLAMHALAQITSGSGRSILHMCAQMGRTEQLRGLLQYDLPLDCRDQAGKAPLHFAAELGMVEVAELLIAGGAAVNLADNFGWTPLSFAANKQQVGIVPLLVHGKADIDSPDSDGFTPLLSTAVEGGAEVARELIRLRANLQVKDSYGHSALTLASQANYIDVVNVLIEAGAKCDETDSDGCTPLMYAAGFGYTLVVKSLLNGKADTSVQDQQEYRAIDFAKDEQHQEIINLLSSFESKKE